MKYRAPLTELGNCHPDVVVAPTTTSASNSVPVGPNAPKQLAALQSVARGTVKKKVMLARSTARASVSTSGPAATKQPVLLEGAVHMLLVPVTRRVPSVGAVATEPVTRVAGVPGATKSWPGAPVGP